MGVTLTVQPDGKLEIAVDPELQADLQEMFALHDKAVAEDDERMMRLHREPDFGTDIMDAGPISPIGNGWDFVRPDEIGALTDDNMPILAYGVSRDDHTGDITAIEGNVVWYDNYFAIRNCVRTLAECGAVLFWREELEG